MTKTWRPNCEFYFEDYYRGREQQECRLISRSQPSSRWKVDLCRSCPVPRIQQANRCPNMILEARIETWLFRRRVVVAAFCTRTLKEVQEPRVGCGQCHRSLAGD